MKAKYIYYYVANTYLYLKASMSYMRHRPPASPSQVDFQSKQVESITLPNRMGEGMYPNNRKMTNWIPKANAFSSSATDRKTTINTGIWVTATNKVIKKRRTINGRIIWQCL